MKLHVSSFNNKLCKIYQNRAVRHIQTSPSRLISMNLCLLTLVYLRYQAVLQVMSIIINPVIMNVIAYVNEYKFVLFTSSVFEPSFLSPEFHHLKLTLKTMI